MGIKLLEVLFFALTFTFLMAWGTIKKQRKSQEMLDLLSKQCEKKIYKAFKSETTWREDDLEAMLEGTQAKLFWSRERAVVNTPEIMLKSILDKMAEKGEIKRGKQKTVKWIKE